MSKWDIIRKISERGDAYGKHGGVLDLLEQTGKSNTQEVTEAEAERFLAEYANPHKITLSTAYGIMLNNNPV